MLSFVDGKGRRLACLVDLRPIDCIFQHDAMRLLTSSVKHDNYSSQLLITMDINRFQDIPTFTLKVSGLIRSCKLLARKS